MLPFLVSDVPLSCINESAIEFHVPAKLIIAVLNVEHGKKGEANKNKDGSYDLGPMQVNSIWLPELKRFSVTKEALQNDPCLNVKVGTWILGKAIASEKELVKGVSDYHSRTPIYNKIYAQKIKVVYTRINFILQIESQD